MKRIANLAIALGIFIAACGCIGKPAVKNLLPATGSL
ncbi:hypothetical protein SAMN05428982_2056 [Pseudoxanthomonas sp. CF385]|nr:hypothetical protein SAMN05428982_2056 [Pseudoxanthomonas sp. CF385]